MFISVPGRLALRMQTGRPVAPEFSSALDEEHELSRRRHELPLTVAATASRATIEPASRPARDARAGTEAGQTRLFPVRALRVSRRPA